MTDFLEELTGTPEWGPIGEGVEGAFALSGETPGFAATALRADHDPGAVQMPRGFATLPVTRRRDGGVDLTVGIGGAAGVETVEVVIRRGAASSAEVITTPLRGGQDLMLSALRAAGVPFDDAWPQPASRSTPFDVPGFVELGQAELADQVASSDDEVLCAARRATETAHWIGRLVRFSGRVRTKHRAVLGDGMAIATQLPDERVRLTYLPPQGVARGLAGLFLAPNDTGSAEVVDVLANIAAGGAATFFPIGPAGDAELHFVSHHHHTSSGTTREGSVVDERQAGLFGVVSIIAGMM